MSATTRFDILNYCAVCGSLRARLSYRGGRLLCTGKGIILPLSPSTTLLLHCIAIPPVALQRRSYYIQNGMIRVEYTESAKMMADGLTKALQNNDFSRFVEHMNLRDIHHLLAKKRELDLQELELEKLDPE
jgi:hypothetical protein